MGEAVIAYTAVLTAGLISLGLAVHLFRHRRKRLRNAAPKGPAPQPHERLGTLAAGLGHDMNNTLFSALHLAAEIKEGSEPGSKLYRSTEALLEAANRAARLSEKLISFALGETEEKIAVDLRGVTWDAIRLRRSEYAGAANLRTRIQPGPAFVRGNPNQLTDVILRLFREACRNLPAGRELRAELATTEEDGRRMATLKVFPQTGGGPPPGSWLGECRRIVWSHGGTLGSLDRDLSVWVLSLPLMAEPDETCEGTALETRDSIRLRADPRVQEDHREAAR